MKEKLEDGDLGPAAAPSAEADPFEPVIKFGDKEIKPAKLCLDGLCDTKQDS